MRSYGNRVGPSKDKEGVSRDTHREDTMKMEAEAWVMFL
jgi:hypothetical protein